MNQKFKFEESEIGGVIKITAFNMEDKRGNFTKDYSKEIFQANGIQHNIQEVFYTTSHKGVIRALHFQREKQQPKLVRCVSGHIYDVVVDLRKNSKTFKKWVAFDLVDKAYEEILIPAGCAHGYIVLEKSIVSYKCAEKFYDEFDDGIIWNDQDIAVDWPTNKIGGIQNLIMSEKDKHLQTFKEFMNNYEGF